MPARYHKGRPPADKQCPLTKTNDDIEYFVIEEIKDVRQMRGKVYLSLYFFEDALKKAGWLPPVSGIKVTQAKQTIKALENRIQELEDWRNRVIEAIRNEFSQDTSVETLSIIEKLEPADELWLQQIIATSESSEGLDSDIPDNESTPEAVPAANKKGA